MRKTLRGATRQARLTKSAFRVFAMIGRDMAVHKSYMCKRPSYAHTNTCVHPDMSVHFSLIRPHKSLAEHVHLWSHVRTQKPMSCKQNK